MSDGRDPSEWKEVSREENGEEDKDKVGAEHGQDDEEKEKQWKEKMTAKIRERGARLPKSMGRASDTHDTSDTSDTSEDSKEDGQEDEHERLFMEATEEIWKFLPVLDMAEGDKSEGISTLDLARIATRLKNPDTLGVRADKLDSRVAVSAFLELEEDWNERARKIFNRMASDVRYHDPGHPIHNELRSMLEDGSIWGAISRHIVGSASKIPQSDEGNAVMFHNFEFDRNRLHESVLYKLARFFTHKLHSEGNPFDPEKEQKLNTALKDENQGQPLSPHTIEHVKNWASLLSMRDTWVKATGMDFRPLRAKPQEGDEAEREDEAGREDGAEGEDEAEREGRIARLHSKLSATSAAVLPGKDFWWTHYAHYQGGETACDDQKLISGACTSAEGAEGTVHGEDTGEEDHEMRSRTPTSSEGDNS